MLAGDSEALPSPGIYSCDGGRLLGGLVGGPTVQYGAGPNLPEPQLFAQDLAQAKPPVKSRALGTDQSESLSSSIRYWSRLSEYTLIQ